MANFLYNGLLFPALPTAANQYVFITHRTGSNYWAYYFANASDFYTQSIDGMMRAVSGATVLRSTINTSGTNVWSTPAVVSVTTISSYLTVVWTNTPVLDENGSVYLEPTDPISLADQTIIEWDGDTTDKERYDYTTPGTDITLSYYRIADAPTEAQMLGGYTVAKQDGAILGNSSMLNTWTNKTYWLIHNGGLYLLKKEADTTTYTSLITYTTALPPSIHPQSFWNGYLLGQKVRRMLKPRKRTYLYNGTELPSLPVWDRKEFPYVAINLGNDGNTAIMCSEKPFEYGTYTASGSSYTNVHLTISAGTVGRVCRFRLENGAWGEQYIASWDMSTSSVGKFIYFDNIFWADYDIPNLDDGTTYLAASRPVLVT